MNEHLCASCKYQQPQCNAVPLCDSITGLITECDKYSKEYCTWSNSDGDNDESCYTNWQTSCGEEFIFDEGTPDSNSFNHCPFCGKTIDQLVES